LRHLIQRHWHARLDRRGSSPTRLGFAGPEDWQWLCFTDPPGDGPLDPGGKAATEFRALIGLADPAHAPDVGDNAAPIIRFTGSQAGTIDAPPALIARAWWKGLIYRWFGR